MVKDPAEHSLLFMLGTAILRRIYFFSENNRSGVLRKE